MTALAAARSTHKMGTGVVPGLLRAAVAASTTIYQGALVVINTSGYAIGGTTATTHQCTMGRAAETVDNSAGANGAKNVQVEPGVFKFNNSAGGDEVLLTHVGEICYVVDDNTVASVSTGRSIAGTVVQIDASTDDGGAGVWVLCAPWDKRA